MTGKTYVWVMLYEDKDSGKELIGIYADHNKALAVCIDGDDSRAPLWRNDDYCEVKLDAARYYTITREEVKS